MFLRSPMDVKDLLPFRLMPVEEEVLEDMEVALEVSLTECK